MFGIRVSEIYINTEYADYKPVGNNLIIYHKIGLVWKHQNHVKINIIPTRKQILWLFHRITTTIHVY